MTAGPILTAMAYQIGESVRAHGGTAGAEWRFGAIAYADLRMEMAARGEIPPGAITEVGGVPLVLDVRVAADAFYLKGP